MTSDNAVLQHDFSEAQEAGGPEVADGCRNSHSQGCGALTAPQAR